MATAADKAKTIGVLGLSAMSTYMKTKAAKDKYSAEVQKDLFTPDPVGRSRINRATMGLSPTLKDQGVKIKAASSLLTDPFNPPLKGADSREIQQSMIKGTMSEVPTQGESARAAGYLEARKRRVLLGSIARRNPELYPKAGAGGREDSTAMIKSQLDKTMTRLRGKSYE